jgi:2-furoyl-CoA dehydrogenase large subunit
MGEQSYLSCAPGAYVGQPRARLEDADLLCARGRFGDDLPVRVGTLHATILRSPYAHAELLAVGMSGH